jgi:hypothetical protein
MKTREEINEQRRKKRKENAAQINARRREAYAKKPAEYKAREAELRKQRRKVLREQRIKEYGPPPPCECGCENPVSFNYAGKPNRFASGHIVRPENSNEPQFSGERIPTQKAAEALERLRQKNGWSINEMAERGNINPKTLWRIMRDPYYAHKYGVDADMLRRMLLNLAGKNPPTKQEMAATERRYRSTEPGKV